MNQLDAEIGPFFDDAGVTKLLGGASPQDLEARRRTDAILALQTADGPIVYPTFQFNGNTVDERILPILRAFAGSPRWSVALWFVTGNPDLDGLTPLAWLRADHDPQRLRRSAQHTAREWA
ncbi:MAG TPA: hypothetical protein VHO29_05130 [Marmoricola sp.]|nr:hypothetical protein [Marmoricola sp.]